MEYGYPAVFKDLFKSIGGGDAGIRIERTTINAA
jgi:hypothetical protein